MQGKRKGGEMIPANAARRRQRKVKKAFNSEG